MRAKVGRTTHYTNLKAFAVILVIKLFCDVYVCSAVATDDSGTSTWPSDAARRLCNSCCSVVKRAAAALAAAVAQRRGDDALRFSAVSMFIFVLLESEAVFVMLTAVFVALMTPQGVGAAFTRGERGRWCSAVRSACCCGGCGTGRSCAARPTERCASVS